MEYPNKKILITTSYREDGAFYEYWGSNVKGVVRYTYDKRNSNGLRFLKKNIPQIDILEYPSWNEYQDALKKGYDIVGFSFFTYEVPRVMKMVEAAKKAKVPELWGGNYGALTYGMEDIFDRLFLGYSEMEVADEIGVEVEEIKHPMIIDYVGTPWGIKGFPLGVLFTNRGCTQQCKFCQTPVFCSEPYRLPLSSIEQVIKDYKEAGVNEVVIEDENFGMWKKHRDRVIDLFVEHDINWHPMTRVDILDKNLDDWYERGFSGTLIGIESLQQDTLDNVGKKIDVEITLDLLKRLEEINAFVIGYYMLGFEEDTIPKIKESLKELNKYSIDLLQVCVITPFPRTPLWDEISDKYGIIDDDWSHWDTKHLVWDHPNISTEEMSSVLDWAFNISYSPKKFIKSPHKYFKRWRDMYGYEGTVKRFLTNFIKANKGIETKIDY